MYLYKHVYTICQLVMRTSFLETSADMESEIHAGNITIQALFVDIFCKPKKYRVANRRLVSSASLETYNLLNWWTCRSQCYMDPWSLFVQGCWSCTDVRVFVHRHTQNTTTYINISFIIYVALNGFRRAVNHCFAMSKKPSHLITTIN